MALSAAQVAVLKKKNRADLSPEELKELSDYALEQLYAAPEGGGKKGPALPSGLDRVADAAVNALDPKNFQQVAGSSVDDQIKLERERKRLHTSAPSDMYKDPRTGGHSNKDWREMFGNEYVVGADGSIKQGDLSVGKVGSFVSTGAGRQQWQMSQSGPRLVAAPMGADEALAKALGKEWVRRDDDTFETLAQRRGDLLRTNIWNTYGTNETPGAFGTDVTVKRPDAWSQGREADKFAVPGQGIVRRTTTGYTRSPEDNPTSQWVDQNKSNYDDLINKRAAGRKTSAFVPTRIPNYPG